MVIEILDADLSLFVFLDNGFITAKIESKFSTIPVIRQEERNHLGNIVLSDDAKKPKENNVVSDVGMPPKGRRRKRKTHYPPPHYLKVIFYEFKIKFHF